MLGRYQHLSNQDIDRQVRELYGLVDKNAAPDPMEPRQCNRCYLVNKPDAMYCNRCGAPLTEEAAGEQTQYSTEAARIAQRLPPEIINAIVAEAVKRLQVQPPAPL